MINDLMWQETDISFFVLSIGGDENLTTTTTLPSMCKLSCYCHALIIVYCRFMINH